ncbi:MAG: HAD family phosphatase [Elusimicrobiota bacterium]|jgi:putative hydrolase of the HAD superfamily
MSETTIKAVFFDIGNVLLHFNPAEVLREVAGAIGRHPIKVARYLWTSNKIEALERGEFGTDELFRLFQEELGYDGTFAQFRKLWCDHFRPERKTVSMLRAVSKRVDTYLLSNTHALHYDYIKQHYAFPKHIRAAVLSHELGMRKPEARIFEAALKIAKVSAEQAVFIDDLKPNVEAARKVGFHAILYKDPDDLRRRLVDLGVL